MSRKDYVLIAATLRASLNDYSGLSRGAAARMVLDLAEAFAGTNPRFDRWRFLNACGLTDSEIAWAERRA